MQELKNVKNTVAKEQEKDSNSQKDNLFYSTFKIPPALFDGWYFSIQIYVYFLHDLFFEKP